MSAYWIYERIIYMGQGQFRELYYITHINNIPSILQRGILSHEIVEKENIEYTPIYDEEIIANRREKKAPNGKSLWCFANLYFQPRNPMLYRVICEKSTDDVVVLAVNPVILKRGDIFVSTGNAACAATDILPHSQFKKALYEIKDDIKKEYWKEEDGSKRKIMAECLVPDVVPPDNIMAIYVANREALNKLKNLIHKYRLSITPQPDMFFQPFIKIELTPYLYLVDGDMFFSRMHTLTVSVNTVGIMGRGLASRAKYQFPDVYVHYQDLCRQRRLKMGEPYLYKPETSSDYKLADEPSTLSNANSETWFILFPTKSHWRERADINGIEKGLLWLKSIYKREGIKSLAIPALGCGLGWLEWWQVGPLLCKYLYSFEIPVRLYLPAEKRISDDFLKPDFLLPKAD